jgi:alanyl-tRNA synthetase
MALVLDGFSDIQALGWFSVVEVAIFLSYRTERLYYSDSYQREFHARVVDSSGDGARVVLDRTAFYPTSGGQPHDLGTIGGIRVTDVIDEDDRIVQLLERPLDAQNEPDCRIDWPRRWDHMQQHTGQHLLSAVVADLFGIQTVSFHMGASSSTIDLATGALSPEQIETAELRANEVVQENRRVDVAFEDAASVEGLRKATERSGTLRVVTIDSLDRSACGGTHVRATGEIGPILLRGVDKIRGNVRLEFLCGGRAVHRTGAEYTALDRAARAFSARWDEVPELVAANLDRLKEADKTRRKLESEIAGFRGRALHGETRPNERGLRVVARRVGQGPIGEDARNEANAFAAGGMAIFIAVSDQPTSVLVATSADTGIHCGNVLKAVLAEFSGRGGGAATLAQGSFSGDPDAFLRRLSDALLASV